MNPLPANRGGVEALVQVSRGLVGVLHSSDARVAVDDADAALRAGLAVVEVTWTTRGAAAVVAELHTRQPEALIGAGSIFTAEQAHEALEAGARFLVGPNFARPVLDVAADRGALYVPGAATPSEVVRVAEAGCPLVKLFPIRELGGIGYLRALLGPLPWLRAMVTGGVSVDEAPAYLAAGAAAVGVGALFAGEATATADRVRRALAALPRP